MSNTGYISDCMAAEVSLVRGLICYSTQVSQWKVWGFYQINGVDPT